MIELLRSHPVSTTILLSFIGLFLLAYIGCVFQFLKNKYSELIDPHIANILINKFRYQTNISNKIILIIHWKKFIHQFINIKQQTKLTKTLPHNVNKFIKIHKIDKKIIKMIKSAHSAKRAMAAIMLSHLGQDKHTRIIENKLSKETKDNIKIYMISALCEIKDTASIPVIIKSFLTLSDFHQKNTQYLLFEFNRELFYYFLRILNQKKSAELEKLIINFAGYYPEPDFKKYLLEKAICFDTSMVALAVKSLKKLYWYELSKPEFLYSENLSVQIAAIEGLANLQTKDNLLNLLELSSNEKLHAHIIDSITKIVHSNIQLLDTILLLNMANSTPEKKKILVAVINTKIEYIIFKLAGKDTNKTTQQQAIKTLIKECTVNGISGFLDKNNDVEIENKIIELLNEEIHQNQNLKNEVCRYFPEKIINKLRLQRIEPENLRKPRGKEPSRKAFVYITLIGFISFFLLLFLWKNLQILEYLTIIEALRLYVIEFNYYLIFYSASINAIYLLILLLSLAGLKKQLTFWNLKSFSLLFKKNVLPSISIIGPSYNEELSIIDSVNSLLNLRYPDYELIMVNDGSTDNTLEKIINFYNMERFSSSLPQNIHTQPIRGVYKSATFPNLTVIDKENGGKADALNTGINASKNNYICAIDADSLLETDAMLKLASQTIDSDHEIVASGGNIFPINGCKVSHGTLEELHIPKNNLAILQGVEYLRAFMARRIGWAHINSLLIISGAFGLFKRSSLIEIGGYLTEKSELNKDTVGEDMELVVRLRKHMSETKQKHEIGYAYNANCWTEVPENLASLYSQRKRWQNGLIDILSLHKKLIFNRKYGPVGLISFPYYFIFEYIGPLIEIKGYILLIVAVFFGLVNPATALLLYLSSIFMGMMVSALSIYISLKQFPYFNLRETTKMLVFSFIENFGIRQLFSFWRVIVFFQSLHTTKGWEPMKRKGFNQT